MALTDQIIGVESGGDPNATNPNSSAMGVGQFIAPTWLSMMRQHRPDLAQGKSDAEILAMRADPALSREMTAAYAADNQATLAKAGLPVTSGTTYLAHFAGPQGAVKILQADPNAPVSDILGAAAVNANPFLRGMTAQGLQAWAARKMGATVPQPGVQNGAPTATPAPPMSLAPPQQPIFAQQQQQQAASAAARPFQPYTDPTLAAPSPIFAAQQAPIDLSGLRAALAARAPIFANPQGMT